MSKINISIIFKKHLATLYNNKTKKLSFVDIFVFYGAPFIISIIVVFNYNTYIHILYNSILMFTSIFIPLFFSSLIFIYSLLQKSHDKLIQELAFNVSYLILINIILLILSLISIFLYLILADNIITFIVNLLLVFLLIHIILTILLVIKRLHIIIVELVFQN